jgi:hypothetical protein
LGDGLFWTGFRKSKGGIPILFAAVLQRREISMGESAKVLECEKRVRCIAEFIFNNWSRVHSASFLVTKGLISLLEITREFLKRLGLSPRFNTPGHPQASGLCERLVSLQKYH